VGHLTFTFGADVFVSSCGRICETRKTAHT